MGGRDEERGDRGEKERKPAAKKAPSREEQLIGSRIGGVRLEKLLGRGAMGAVFLGNQESLDRRVAVKVLSSAPLNEEASAERFFKEARAAAKINHPNVVQVYDAGISDDTPFILMELVEGEGLGRRIKRLGKLPQMDAIDILIGATRGLAAAHQRGLIHRDIKPDNILIATDGTPKLADFGLTKDISANASEMTLAGHLLGTPNYMSPEACSGSPLDPRSDLYSLGITLFLAVTGKLPFKATSLHGLLLEHLTRKPPSPRSIEASIHPRLEEIILRLLEKEPQARFSSAQRFVDELVFAREVCGDADGGSAAPLPDPDVGKARGGVPEGKRKATDAREDEKRAIPEDPDATGAATGPEAPPPAPKKPLPKLLPEEAIPKALPQGPADPRLVPGEGSVRSQGGAGPVPATAEPLTPPHVAVAFAGAAGGPGPEPPSGGPSRKEPPTAKVARRSERAPAIESERPRPQTLARTSPSAPQGGAPRPPPPPPTAARLTTQPPRSPEDAVRAPAPTPPPGPAGPRPPTGELPLPGELSGAGLDDPSYLADRSRPELFNASRTAAASDAMMRGPGAPRLVDVAGTAIMPPDVVAAVAAASALAPEKTPPSAGRAASEDSGGARGRVRRPEDLRRFQEETGVADPAHFTPEALAELERVRRALDMSSGAPPASAPAVTLPTGGAVTSAKALSPPQAPAVPAAVADSPAPAALASSPPPSTISWSATGAPAAPPHPAASPSGPPASPSGPPAAPLDPDVTGAATGTRAPDRSATAVGARTDPADRTESRDRPPGEATADRTAADPAPGPTPADSLAGLPPIPGLAPPARPSPTAAPSPLHAFETQRYGASGRRTARPGLDESAGGVPAPPAPPAPAPLPRDPDATFSASASGTGRTLAPQPVSGPAPPAGTRRYARPPASPLAPADPAPLAPQPTPPRAPMADPFAAPATPPPAPSPAQIAAEQAFSGGAGGAVRRYERPAEARPYGTPTPPGSQPAYGAPPPGPGGAMPPPGLAAQAAPFAPLSFETPAGLGQPGLPPSPLTPTPTPGGGTPAMRQPTAPIPATRRYERPRDGGATQGIPGITPGLGPMQQPTRDRGDPVVVLGQSGVVPGVRGGPSGILPGIKGAGQSGVLPGIKGLGGGGTTRQVRPGPSGHPPTPARGTPALPTSYGAPPLPAAFGPSPFGAATPAYADPTLPPADAPPGGPAFQPIRAEAPVSSGMTLEDLLKRAKYHYARDNLGAAERDFARAIELDPTHAVAHFAMACCLARQRKGQPALDFLDRAVSLGFRDRKVIAGTAELSALTSQPRYRQILQKLK